MAGRQSQTGQRPVNDDLRLVCWVRTDCKAHPSVFIEHVDKHALRRKYNVRSSCHPRNVPARALLGPPDIPGTWRSRRRPRIARCRHAGLFIKALRIGGRRLDWRRSPRRGSVRPRWSGRSPRRCAVPGCEPPRRRDRGGSSEPGSTGDRERRSPAPLIARPVPGAYQARPPSWISDPRQTSLPPRASSASAGCARRRSRPRSCPSRPRPPLPAPRGR
jgi:hypothetical protein